MPIPVQMILFLMTEFYYYYSNRSTRWGNDAEFISISNIFFIEKQSDLKFEILTAGELIWKRVSKDKKKEKERRNWMRKKMCEKNMKKIIQISSLKEESWFYMQISPCIQKLDWSWFDVVALLLMVLQPILPSRAHFHGSSTELKIGCSNKYTWQFGWRVCAL